MNTTHANHSHALWQKAYQEAGIVPQLKAPEYSNLAALVHDMCLRYAQQDPKKKAYTCVVPNGMNGNLTFKQVDEMSDAFAGYLRGVLGLQAGDRVAVQLPNSLSYPIVAFGIMKAGCVLVNTNPLYTESEMIHQFNDSGAKALVIIDMFANKLPEVLAKTQIKHVVVADVTAFFPAVPRRVIRLVQKVWNRVLPSITVPHERIASALKKGAATLAQTPAKTYWEHIGPDEMAVLQYTGGTTGVSKGAVLTHSNLLNNVNQMLAMGGTHMQIGTECVLTALPIYHIFAFTANLLGFLVIGARNILIPSPRPVQNLQRAIENYPVTWMTGVNTLYNALLNEEWFLAYPPKHLKASIAGGTALHLAVAQRWREVTKTPIAEGYGLTETSPVATFNPLSGKPRNGIGIPTPGTDVRLVGEDGQLVGIGEPGEIQVKGPQVMKAYWQQDQETAKVLHDGWLATGDVAMMDEEGYLRIVDRKKDMILVSGFNVYPNEVEDVIAQMDAVLEVAVVGVPDPVSGEAVRAYVVPNPEHDGELKTADVIAHCKSQLTNYKVPHQVLIRHDLPKTPIGKVLRKTLRAEALAEMGAPRQ
ncbi:MAG: long-chain fatty acid--CoA ligase [Burkholderiaceae bacterium]|nr:long-chain fatty acid--CoA ligase [Burkholderiaceae bacterium]